MPVHLPNENYITYHPIANMAQGIPIMLLHNLNHSQGLCNGTRLIVTTLGDLIIEVEIMTGKHREKLVLIPRICLTLKTPKIPFVLE
jgi:ATP-dependent DNA helicase PIF1